MDQNLDEVKLSLKKILGFVAFPKKIRVNPCPIRVYPCATPRSLAFFRKIVPMLCRFNQSI